MTTSAERMDDLSILIEAIKRFNSHEDVVEVMVHTLWKLTFVSPLAVQEAVLLNLPVFVQLLDPSRKWFTAHASIGLIRNLLQSTKYETALRNKDLFPLLVQRLKMAQEDKSMPIFKKGDMYPNVYECLILLLNFLIEPSNRAVIRELDILPILAKLFDSKSFPDSIQSPAIFFLDKLANDPEGLKLINETVEVVSVLKQLATSSSADETIKSHAEAILDALEKHKASSEIKEEKQEPDSNEDVVPIYIRNIHRFHSRDEIVEPAVHALKNLTCGKEGPEVAKRQALLFSLPAFIQLLEPNRQWPVASESIGLIRNLAKYNCYSTPLREQGAIPALVYRLKLAEQQGQAVVDDVRMIDIVQSTLVTLSRLAEAKDNRRIIREQGVIPTLVRLFSSNLESIHGPALIVVHLLATDPEGVQMIYDTVGRNETVGALKQLSNSPTELIKKVASGILHALGKYQQNRQGVKRNSAGMATVNAPSGIKSEPIVID